MQKWQAAASQVVLQVRSYKVEDFSPASSPDIAVLEKGSVVGDSGPEPTDLPTQQTLANITKKVRVNRQSDHVSQVQYTFSPEAGATKTFFTHIFAQIWTTCQNIG